MVARPAVSGDGLPGKAGPYSRKIRDMAIPYANENQWRVLWIGWLLLSLVWTNNADYFSSALGVFGAPVIGFLVLVLLKYRQKQSDTF